MLFVNDYCLSERETEVKLSFMVFLYIERLKLIDLCLDERRNLDFKLFVTRPVWSCETLNLELKCAILTLGGLLERFNVIFCFLKVN